MAVLPDSATAPKIQNHVSSQTPEPNIYTRQLYLDIEHDVLELFGGVVALTAFAETIFNDTIDIRGRTDFRVHEEEREALFVLIFLVNRHARAIRDRFNEEQKKSALLS